MTKVHAPRKTERTDSREFRVWQNVLKGMNMTTTSITHHSSMVPDNDFRNNNRNGCVRSLINDGNKSENEHAHEGNREKAVRSERAANC